ncbi:MAG: hypothetical protein WBP12_03375 [Candidatus Saccharimonas sp.]
MTSKMFHIIVAKRQEGKWSTPILLAQQLRRAPFAARISYKLGYDRLTAVVVEDETQQEAVIQHMEAQGWEIVYTYSETEEAVLELENTNSYETVRVKRRPYITVSNEDLL